MLLVLKSCNYASYSDHYGFVTFYDMNDAFAAIDNGSKLRRPDELPFDLCFGGRRQFCNSVYADLGKTWNRDKKKSIAFVKSNIFPYLTVDSASLGVPLKALLSLFFLQATK